MEANDSSMKVEGIGRVKFNVNLNGESRLIFADNVLLVTEIATNLLSVSTMVKNGKNVVFDDNGCKIYDGGKVIATAHLDNGLLVLDCPQPNFNLLSRQEKSVDILMWHRRMGHPNFEVLNKLKTVCSDVHFDKGDVVDCSICLLGKQARRPNRGFLCGPIEELSMGGARYILTFVEDHSRTVFIYVLKNKSDVLQSFKLFKNLVENQTGKQIKVIRTDNGSEYCNTAFKDFIGESGIQLPATVPYTPQQNGVAERMNRTLVKKVRCMLFDAELDKTFWEEAVSTAAYIINRLPSRSLNNKTPEEIWNNEVPSLQGIRVFGCKCFAHVRPKIRGLLCILGLC